MTRFHTDEYVDFLNRVTPETAEDLTYQGTRCAWPNSVHQLLLTRYPVLVGDDNPAFEGVFEFCSISAGGSLGAPLSNAHRSLTHTLPQPPPSASPPDQATSASTGPAACTTPRSARPPAFATSTTSSSASSTSSAPTRASSTSTSTATTATASRRRSTPRTAS